MAQDRVQWRASVNTVMSLQVPQKGGSFDQLSNYQRVMTLHHGTRDLDIHLVSSWLLGGISHISNTYCSLKVKLSLCLTEYHAMKVYGGVET
jgi:hypothetical protein